MTVRKAGVETQHINRNIIEILTFIWHVSSITGILSFPKSRQRLQYFVHASVVYCTLQHTSMSNCFIFIFLFKLVLLIGYTVNNIPKI